MLSYYCKAIPRKNRTSYLVWSSSCFVTLNTPRDDCYALRGRAVRRLVSITEHVDAMVGEHDRRVALELRGHDGGNGSTDQSEQNEYLYRSYQQLIRWIPSIQKLVLSQNDPFELTSIYNRIMKGADAARGEDATHLKSAVASWLPFEPGQAKINPRYKDGRGFYNDATGRLICPVDYNWEDTEIKEKIRNYHPDYLVTAYSWPAFLYKNNIYDPNNPSVGLFKGSLLVKAFKHIFTSPSSASDSPSDDEEQPRKKQRASGERLHNQLRFAFSSCGSWRIIDEDFNYEVFYNNIVDYFELPPTPEAKADVEELLFWWNQAVFGRTNSAIYRPQPIGRLSVAVSSAKRPGACSAPSVAPV
ncbi:hypothetical protein BV22DRAFT_1026345 [Leucogyrophana mollusca]|uniref:Uncharacterized protein n=1 Tax=Leucogyrophana mollusca TaxID=85980 RepID=A0ACB8AXY8_9AGAM|nr:hypothetical protein BV22DRAFT_1026345 [Leucogyrophana mollusca]